MESCLAKVIRIQVWDLVREYQLESVDAYGMLVLAFGLVEEPIEEVVPN